MGLQARLMSQALRKMSGNASKAGCTLIFLNQIRYKVKIMTKHSPLMYSILKSLILYVSMLCSWTDSVFSYAIKIGVYYGNPEVTSGGIALKFFASVRLEIRSAGKIKSVRRKVLLVLYLFMCGFVLWKLNSFLNSLLI